MKPIAESPTAREPLSGDSRFAARDVAPRETGPEPGRPQPAGEPNLAAARRALEEGNYDVAVQLTGTCLENVEGSVLHVKALANIDVLSAATKCGDLTMLHPVSAELHYLHALLLSQLKRDREAVKAGRRVVFIDRKLAIAHFTIATVLQRSGELAEARRHFRNARNICRQRPLQEVVAFSNGETAGHLAEAAESQLASIDAAIGT